MDSVINFIRGIVPATEVDFYVPSGITPWIYSGSSVDMDFVNDRYWSDPDFVTATDLISVSRASVGYAETTAGVLTLFNNNILRITNRGLLVEDTRTNVVLWDRDLTNAAWVPTNITPLKDQTGPDEVANSASSLEATAGNGTILQSITLASSARFQSAYVKRIAGSGTINMTMDNGATWTAITVTSGWTRVSIPTQTLANPVVGFQIVTSGDKIAVDFVQNENGVFASSPIPTTTTSAARAADVVTTLATLIALLDAAAASVLASVILSDPLVQWGVILTGDIGGSHYPNFMGKSSSLSTDNIAYMALSNAIANLESTFGAGIAWATGVKVASSWDASGSNNESLSGGGSAASTKTTPRLTTDATYYIGANTLDKPYGYIRRITFWNSRLSDSVLQSLSTP